MKTKKVKCPYCKRRFKWSHLYRSEWNGTNKDFCITRESGIK